MVASGPDRNRMFGSGWYKRQRKRFMALARRAISYNEHIAAEHVAYARWLNHQRLEALRRERTL